MRAHSFFYSFIHGWVFSTSLLGKWTLGSCILGGLNPNPNCLTLHYSVITCIIYYKYSFKPHTWHWRWNVKLPNVNWDFLFLEGITQKKFLLHKGGLCDSSLLFIDYSNMMIDCELMSILFVCLQDQLGDVLHWIRQIVALVCGLLWGAVPLVGGIWLVA